jgi:transcriptional regulator with XRE-family HTH domain
MLPRDAGIVKRKSDYVRGLWTTVEYVAYSQRMTSDQPAGDYSGLSGVHVTVDQVVAMNVRYWRQKAEITQQELGERIGWTAPNVSAAELSADPAKDKRRFDAQTLVSVARALRIPLAALFLPPEDDGIARRYLIDVADECLGMNELAAAIVSAPDDGDGPVITAYRERYLAVLTTYGDPGRGEQLARYMEDLTTASERAERLQRLRWQREALAATVVDIDRLVDTIADMGRES